MNKIASYTSDIFQGLLKGNRYSLAKGITLIESSRRDHHEQSQILLQLCLNEQNRRNNSMSSAPSSSSSGNFYPGLGSFRIGFSGSPGVGKSTFIEGFGSFLVQQLGHRVAVLAVDPSSSKTGGSLLGDKTRMTELSRMDGAYVRPSPTGGALGGVARTTMESILLCETAGFDTVLVETVGVGQSEIMVSEMVDLFVLLVPPAGGDELQGMKRGIMENSDIVIVNKADGDLLPAAQRAKMEYTSALKYLASPSPNWNPPVLMASSIDKKSFPRVHESIQSFYNQVELGLLAEGDDNGNIHASCNSNSNSNSVNASGGLSRKRQLQRKQWLWRTISSNFMYDLKNDENIREFSRDLEKQVVQGFVTPGRAADKILAFYYRSKK